MSDTGRYEAERRDALDGHLTRHERLASELAAGGWNKLTVDTNGLAPSDVSTAVVRHLGLAHTGTSRRLGSTEGPVSPERPRGRR